MQSNHILFNLDTTIKPDNTKNITYFENISKQEELASILNNCIKNTIPKGELNYESVFDNKGNLK